tara:strand:+ start:439 stop:1065 length:627 start_codon:yes stop_codon:yes gene_type:complete
MASTYTVNTGIEKIGTGEQSGTWGTTTNLNLDIVDRAINGVGSISLSGTTHTLTTSDGSLSDGMYKVLILGGSPSGTNTITIAPNDAAKFYAVVNASGQDAVFTQGSGSNVTIANGNSGFIYADGAGASAAVGSLSPPTDLVNDTTPQLGGNLDTNGNSILFGSSKWGVLLDTGDNDLLFQYNGTTVFKIASNGALTSANDITAFGSP